MVGMSANCATTEHAKWDSKSVRRCTKTSCLVYLEAGWAAILGQQKDLSLPFSGVLKVEIHPLQREHSVFLKE
jgi:hypothetical protein